MDPENHKECGLRGRGGESKQDDKKTVSDSGTTVGRSKKDIYEYYSDHPSVIFSGPNDIGISDAICTAKDGQEYTSGISEVILYCDSQLVDKSTLFYRNLGLNVSTQEAEPASGIYHSNLQANQSQSESFIKLSPSENCRILSYDSTKKLSLLIDLEFVVNFFRNRVLFDKTQISDSLGNVVEIKAWNRKDIRIAILTSGGDAPGMNSVVRSVVRTGIKYNIHIYGVYRGFEGLMSGDIRKLSWNSETHNSYLGGTTLLSVRSDKFKTREGRKEAVLNLSKRGINNLIIIGGDGSMTGGLILKEEFGELVEELEAEGRYDNPDSSYNARWENKLADETLPSTDVSVDSSYKYLNKITRTCNIIGIPATIDNDVYGSETTIGSDSCLTRIMDAVDNLLSTMRSHRRVFVIETMGRNCGWIALLSAFAVSADFVLLPEHIYSKDGKDHWKQELIKSIKTAYNNHKPDILIFLSEGAVDLQFNKIDLETVVETVREAGFDVRGLTLGHIQRGGYTSAQDRIIGTVSGIKVVNEILLRHSFKNEPGQSKQTTSMDASPLSSKADHSSEEDVSFAEMIAYNCDEYSFIDLEKVIFETKKLKGFYDSKDFKSIFVCRHQLFKYIFNQFEKLRINKIRTIFTEGRFDSHIGEERIFEEVKVHNLFSKKFVRIPRLCNSTGISGNGCTESSGPADDISSNFQDIQKTTVGVIMDGVRACGMNTAINMLCEMGISSGANILYFLQGYDGVISNQPIEARLYEFSTKINDGGVGIGSSKTIPPIDSMISALKSYGVNTLVIIGGSRNLKVINDFKRFSDISAILIPATSKNNIPGTSKSIGTDSALNIITRSTVANKLSAVAMENTIFMVEIGGDNCSYLSIMGGIASSAYEVLINNTECSKENHCRTQSKFTSNTGEEEACADEIVLSGHDPVSANTNGSTESTDDLKSLGYLKSNLVENFGNYKRSSIVIFRNQNTFNKMSTESLCRLLRHDSYQISYSVLGHLEKGLYPTFIDRVNANLLSIMALDQGVKTGQHCGVVGFKCTKPHFTDIEEVLEMYDEDLETTKCPFWLKYKDVCGFLEE